MDKTDQKTNLDIKNTLLITIDFPPQKGGVANYLANFCTELPQNKIFALANNQYQAQSFDSRQKYKIFRQDLYYNKFWPQWLKTFFIAKTIIKKQAIEQVMISHILPMGYIALLLGKPFFLIFHGYDILAAQKNVWKKFWLKIILKRAKHIIVNSQFTKNEVLKFAIPDNKITIIYPSPNVQLTDLNPAETQIIKNELELDNKKILLSVGRFIARKGFDNVIKALPPVIKKYPDLVYILTGKGDYKKELDQLAIDHKVRGNVIFIANAPDTHIASYYDLADIFIMPSRIVDQVDAEGFGIVYLEAGLFAKPVIAGNTGGAPEAVINGQTGILVNPGSVREISQAILQLLDRPELMNKLGMQARQRVMADFQLKNQIIKLNHIL